MRKEKPKICSEMLGTGHGQSRQRRVGKEAEKKDKLTESS